MTDYSTDAYRAADEVIADVLARKNVDYSEGREEIARVFDDELWNGNWDSSTDFEEIGLTLPDLRFIQEDEFDQHMEDGEGPDFEDQICYSAGHYVFEA